MGLGEPPSWAGKGTAIASATMGHTAAILNFMVSSLWLLWECEENLRRQLPRKRRPPRSQPTLAVPFGNGNEKQA
jgi:hypothetical protein